MKRKMLDWDDYKKELLKDPKVRAALKETELEYQVARALIKARIEKGLTQKQLAHKMKTKQSAISRLESANSVPSLNSLRKVAQALGATLSIRFVF